MTDLPPPPLPQSPSCSARVVAALGGLSMLVLGGLAYAGSLERMNRWLSEWFSGQLGEVFGQRLPEWSVWLVAALVAGLMPALLLATAGGWRRLLLWLAAIGVMAAWAPVLALAAYDPGVAEWGVVTLVAGLLTMICAGRRCRRRDDAVSSISSASDGDEPS